MQKRQLRTPWQPAIWTLVAITAVVVFVTWPQAPRITTHFGGHTDALFSIWRLAWIADSVRSPRLHVFDAPIFYPSKNTLAFSDAILLSGALTAPFRWIGGNPYIVYNVYLMLSFVASGFAAALLCHRLTGSWVAAATGGVIFTVSPHRMEHFERLELITSFGIPLAFYCWHVGTGNRSHAWFAAAFISIAFQWYVGMYHAVFLATVMSCLVIDWWTEDARAKRIALSGSAVGALIAVLLIAPSTAPYLEAREEVGDRPLSEVEQYSAELKNFVAVHPRNWLYGAQLSKFGAPERYFFPGTAALILAVTGVFCTPRKKTLLYGAVLVVGVELTLGSNGALFPLLRSLGGPYRSLRSPARADVVVLLPIAVFASFAVARLTTRLTAVQRVAAVALLLSVLAIEYKTLPILWDVPPEGKTPLWMPPPDAVLVEYPLPPPARMDLSLDASYMAARIGTWPKMLNGYSGHLPRHYDELVNAVVDFPSERAIAAMVFHGATHLAVHELWLEARYGPLLEQLLKTPQLEIVARYQEYGKEVSVFRLGAARLR